MCEAHWTQQGSSCQLPVLWASLLAPPPLLLSVLVLLLWLAIDCHLTCTMWQ
jgi:hypothetical protein